MPARAEMPLPNMPSLFNVADQCCLETAGQNETRLSYNITDFDDFSDDKFAMLGGEPYSNMLIKRALRPSGSRSGQRTNSIFRRNGGRGGMFEHAQRLPVNLGVDACRT
jgi:hypothetical protein